MSNSLTQFSFTVAVPDPAATAAAYAAALLERAEAGVLVEVPDQAHPVFGEDPYATPPELTAVTDEDEPHVWLTDDAGESDLDCTAAVVRWLLRTQGGIGPVFFEWADTCTKPRVGAFGGGAMVVTAVAVEALSTGMLHDQLLRFVTTWEAPSEPMATDDLPMCPICFALLDDDGTCPEPENHDGV